jgi:hypothetical protein
MEKIKNYPVGPFPTVLAGADVNGKPNYATAGACGVVCMEPILYVSLKITHYTTRGHTGERLLQHQHPLGGPGAEDGFLRHGVGGHDRQVPGVRLLL